MKSLVNRLLCLIIIVLSFAAFAANDNYSIYSSAKKNYNNHDFEVSYYLFKEYIDSTEFTSKQNKRLLGDSYFHIGHYFKCGHYLPCNIDSAINYLNIAAFAYDNADAARMLHSIYYYKQYNHLDKDKSFAMLKLAADLGDYKSNLEVGNIYLFGKTKVLKDTTTYTTYQRVKFNGDTIIERGARWRITPTKSTLNFPNIQQDSTLGYYYYERGVSVNHELINDIYTLNEIDFIRTHMEGSHSPIDYEKAWSYLQQHLFSPYNSYIDEDENLPEIYWRIQVCYRFGLGTRMNIHKADLYLNESAKLGFPKAIEALQNLNQ